MDSREDEQQRGITMKSSAISLHHVSGMCRLGLHQLSFVSSVLKQIFGLIDINGIYYFIYR